MPTLNKFFLAAIILGIILSATSVLYGNITFHVDIARDFLLLQELVDKGDFSLIGPRAAGIDGLFHGPLWMYLNAPAYYVGGGNPVVVGWFWILLSIITICSIYWVGKKLYGKTEGLAAAALFSTISYDVNRGLYNPYGAVMIAPFFFYTLLSYIRTKKNLYLLLTYFLIGLLIQFQLAFGIPMLILSLFLTSRIIFQNQLYIQLSSYFIILIPLATHILFELRNNFLQIRSVLAYLHTAKASDLTFAQQIMEYFRAVATGVVITRMPHPYEWISGLVLLLIILLAYKYKSNKELNLFLYLYIGFWVIAYLFKGKLQSYYAWPFVPLVFLLLASLKNAMEKNTWLALISLLIFWHIALGIIDANDIMQNPQNGGWIVNKAMAHNIFASTNQDFGYYIFTPELFGYSPRYAMDYMQKQSSHKAFPFEKKKTTFLIIDPPVKNNIVQDMTWWKKSEVGISKKPVSTNKFGNYIIEKYELSEEEIAVPSNPNLIHDVHFR